MPITYNTAVAETVFIDPGDARGPWTVKLPPPNLLLDTAWCRVVATTNATEQVIFDGNGKSIRNTLAGQDQPTITAPMDASAVYFYFNEPEDKWYAVGGFAPIDEFAFEVHWSTQSTSIQFAPTNLALPNSDGENERFSKINGNTALQCLRALPTLEVTFSAQISAVATTNNQEISILLDLAVTGAGTHLIIPAEWPFQSSRSGTFVVGISGRARLGQLNVGDTLTLQATRLATSTMVADVNQVILEIPPSPRY